MGRFPYLSVLCMYHKDLTPTRNYSQLLSLLSRLDPRCVGMERHQKLSQPLWKSSNCEVASTEMRGRKVRWVAKLI